jgi:hypothetical protein
MLQEYLITLYGKTANRNVRIGYRDGKLALVSIPEGEEFDDAAITFLLNWLRSQISETQMLENRNDTTLVVRFRADIIEPDVTFASFYNAYGYKVGNKKRAEAEWNKLSPEDKVRCLQGVRRYNVWIAQRRSQEKLYPETFLSQSRWENEFKI